LSLPNSGVVSMSILLTTYDATTLPRFLADDMIRLTRDGSLHQQWLSELAVGKQHETLPPDWSVAVAAIDEDFHIQPIGWTSLHVWNGEPSMEGFVDPTYRRLKVASMTAAALCLSVPRELVAVFSPEYAAIAKWLGFQQVNRYVRCDDGWIKTHG